MSKSKKITWTLIEDSGHNQAMLNLVKLFFLNTREATQHAIDIMEAGSIDYTTDLAVNMDELAQKSCNNLFFYAILSSNLKIIKYLIANTDEKFTDINCGRKFYMFENENDTTLLRIMLNYSDYKVLKYYLENHLDKMDFKTLVNGVLPISLLFPGVDHKIFCQIYELTYNQKLPEQVIEMLKYREDIILNVQKILQI